MAIFYELSFTVDACTAIELKQNIFLRFKHLCLVYFVCTNIDSKKNIDQTKHKKSLYQNTTKI